MAAEQPQLFHFTCQHGYRDIGHSGVCVLLPYYHPWLGKKLLWLTTAAEPNRELTGLTSKYISCDRMQHRYVVTQLGVARSWLDSPERMQLSAAQLDNFELTEDGLPASVCEWWISDLPLRARYDRTWHA